MFINKFFNNISGHQISKFGIYGIGQAVNLISPLLVLPYIISICGEEGLGKSGVGFSLALIAIVLVDYGSYINGTKDVSINTTNKVVLEEIFLKVYLSKSILLILVLFFLSLFCLIIPFFRRDFIQFLLSFSIIVGQFVNPTWFLQGIQNFKWISIINVLSKVLYLLLIFIFIKQPQDYIYINLFYGLGLFFSSLIAFFWIRKKFSFNLSNFSMVKAKELIKSEFSLTISQLFFSFYQYSPIIIVGFLGGNQMAGQFKIIDQIVMLFRTYFQVFFNFIYPDVCLRIFNNAKEGVSNWFLKNVLNYVLILFIIILFYWKSTDILMYFNVENNSFKAIQGNFEIALLIPVFMGISFALKQLVFAFSKNNVYIFITIITTFLSLLLVGLLTSTFGLLGAFLTLIFTEIIVVTLYLIVLKDVFFLKIESNVEI